MSAPALHLSLACAKCGAPPGEPCHRLDGQPAIQSHHKRYIDAPCGTRGAYIRHVKRGEVPCDPCRDAHRRYMSAYRDKRPEVRERDIDLLRVRRVATRRLIELHRDEFDRLLAESAPDG